MRYFVRESDRGLLAWDVERLIRLSAPLPRRYVPLAQIAELDEVHWFTARRSPPSVKASAADLRRVEKADLNRPIILSWDGRVMEWLHRVVKALLSGHETVAAKQFTEPVEPDYVGVAEAELPSRTKRKKFYGRDGPPQLRGRVEDIPLEDVPKFYGEEGLLNWHVRVPGWWGKRMRCACGAFDAYEVLRGTSTLAGWVGGKPYGDQRCDLRCTRCGERFLFFDDGVHGWNAVIGGDRDTLPPEYLESNAKLLQPLACTCGGRVFSVIAEVTYDCGEGIEDIPESQWDDAYGWFNGTARCAACGELHDIADQETA